MSTEPLNAVFSALNKVLKTEPGRAFTMPGEFYTSEKFLEVEREQLFSNKWLCVGRAEEIPKVGDYFTFQVNDESIIIIRQADDRIKALSNVCRHRAMPLVEGEGNTKKFVCSYHAWTYDLNGQLLRAQGLDDHHSNFVKQCKLPEFKCELWHGFIFINLNPHAESFLASESCQEVEALVSNMHIGDMRLIYSNVQEWDVNWKCLVENFMEGYHLSVVHRKTIHPYTPTKLAQHIESKNDYFGFFSYYPPDAPVRGHSHPDVTDEEKNRSLMLCIPPASVFGISGFKVTYNLIQPVTATRLRTKIGMLAVVPQDEEQKEKLEVGIELFKNTFAEDKTELIKLMQGLKSQFYRPSLLAKPDYEGTIWDFYNYIARNVTSHN